MTLRSIKLWINIFTFAALALLVFFAREQIGSAFSTLGRLNLLWLGLIIPLQLLNHYSVAKFYQSYLLTLGEQLPTKELYKVSLEMNFVNNVFPSGGVSGFGYLGVRLKRHGIKGSKSTLLQTSRHFLTFISFIVLLVVALLLLSIFGSASRFIILIATSLSSLIIFGTLALLYIISNEERIRSFSSALPKMLNRFLGLFKKSAVNTIKIERIESLFSDLHNDFMQVKKDWRSLKKPFLWTTLMNVTEITTIFVVYLSFGSLVNPGAIIMSYAVANIAGLVSVLPGGIGVYEGLMTAVMASAGIPNALALSATVVYRVVNMSIFLPIGYFFYQKTLRVRRQQIEEIE